uniref:Odorant receptor n=1 Tax=Musca domestica TaxID=7370 RepID=A0A1I8MWE3_MUSDO
MAKTVAQSYDKTILFIKISSAVCGANVLSPAYRMNILTWIVIVCINLYYVFTGYTLYVNIYVEKDWPNVLQVLCYLGSAVQGYCKLLNAIHNKESLRFLDQELREIYLEYDQKHADYRYCLKTTIDRANKFIKFMIIFQILISGSLIGVAPFYRLVFNQRIFVMQFLLPGVDPSTEYGYFVMNCMHCICIIFGSFGNFAADLFFFVVVSHVPMFKDILTCKFHDLNDLLEEEVADNENNNNNNRIKDVREDFRSLLIDIFKWHQRYLRFIAIVKENYFWVLLVEMGTVALSLASTLFCLILGTWPGGQSYLAYCFIMLYIYCGLGTVVEVTNDGFIDSCYTEIIWYKLPVSQRKMLRMMLMMAQNTDGLTIGSVIPLSMNTGLQLTKTIYTMTMMLINFLE